MSLLQRLPMRRKPQPEPVPFWMQEPDEHGQLRWTIVLHNDREFWVEAEDMHWARNDSVLAFNDDAYAWDPGAIWSPAPPRSVYFFTASRKVQQMAGPRQEEATDDDEPTKYSRAKTAMQGWHSKHADKPGPMYGSVLQEEAHFASGKNEELHIYQDGRYVPAKEFVYARLQDLVGTKWTRTARNEVFEWLLGRSPGLEDGIGPDIINVRNGLLIWTKGRWRLNPHDPELRTTVQLPVTYVPGAKCPMYNGFLESSMPDKATRLFLDEWAGYNLTSDYAHQKALMLGGESGSGKSQYLYVLGRLIGPDSVCAASLHSIVHDRFTVARLYGKLANICADISSEDLRMSAKFKQLTGGDLIDAEKKHKDGFDFRNAAKLSFSANAIPATRDTSSAFFDRWIIVKFPRKFRDTADENKNIGQQIANDPDEMSGVLNRALSGLTRLRREGHFTEGSMMRAAYDEFRRQTDTVALFVVDVATKEKRRYAEQHAMYQYYRGWCEANGHGQLSSTKFYERLEDWTPVKGISVRPSRSKGEDRLTIEKRGG